ncbi:lipoprotein [Shewanella sp. AS1]|uniref:LPS translocon maturation chaperone LptM n=1 Tax=Shewanella sp. AS1 TaxID=2907626 RepID=UPI001F1AD514|nr:lipoprotein [Shewanella sp. AS1]MCE9680459.1 lipoprotein [Shewanella sp. AS1]
MKLITLMLLGSLFMVACGQKGPLYRSPEAQDNQAQGATDAEQTYESTENQSTESESTKNEEQ